MDARSVLGLPPMRPALLVDVSSAQSRQAQARIGAGIMISPPNLVTSLTGSLRLDDDDLDDFDEDDDDFDDDDEGSDEDEDGEDDEEEETWQVGLKYGIS